ncbi:hypothetical protein JCM19992_04070 [Thermostilla marina]
MKAYGLLCAMAAGAALSVLGSSAASAQQFRVHAVSDLGHEFSFYADGRFHRQYLPGQPVASSWGSLFNYDFSNANLLILLGCDAHVDYVPADIAVIDRFLQVGGGVVLLGSAPNKAQNKLAGHFGCHFGKPARKPLRGDGKLITGDIQGGGDTIQLDEPSRWMKLIVDADGNPVLVARAVGRGTLLVGARGLAGRNPNGKDNINAAWWQPLLVRAAMGKPVDPRHPPDKRGILELEHSIRLGSITVRFSDYLAPYAESMAKLYMRCRPYIERRMGVPLSKGMASEIGLLATGSGGFSTGRTIGLGVFWGGFPEREADMIQLLTHESVHSWVLPFSEIWSEPIATYVGDLVLIDMGYEEAGKGSIKARIDRAKRLDPTMKVYDLHGYGPPDARKLSDSERNAIHWGKTFWIFEQLRQEDPNIVAHYFQVKRALAKPGRIKQYDLHATVAVMSIAMKRNLFPWFNEHGIPADPRKSPIPLPPAFFVRR